ncbi:MAG: tryptophan 7-halogenase [Minicystis sp.]
MQDQEARPAHVASVGVLGGGTAGYFTAIALKRRFPGLRVTVVESSAIPIIGVGEATTTLMPPFLHHQLGIDIVELYREVRPTWKLGIKFDWGLPGDYYFTYPFGLADSFDAYRHDGDIRNQNLASLLMAADRSPILRDAAGEVQSLLLSTKLAYHLHNAPFVAFLAKHAARSGVEHIDARVEVVAAPDQSRIEMLRADDGRELRFDLYVDASGFSAQILGKALASPFQSFASSLFCDRAVVADVPQRGGIVEPYTTAETMDHGWCWKIPVEGVDHRGYVHASAFVSEADAIAEMRRKNPGMGDTWTVRFRSGRHAEFWKGNAVAVGNAYGFVEPLESTALHMVIIEIAYLVAGLEAAGSGPVDLAETNRRVGAHWDYLRWFLAIHYKFNRKLDTAFWRACREEVDVSGIAHALTRYQEQGPWKSPADVDILVGDPAFGYSGLLVMLLGQKVDAPVVPSRFSPEAWAKRLADQRALVDRALPQAEALEILRARPDLLQAFVSAPSSWCNTEGEVIVVSPATGRTHMPHAP